MSLYEKIRKPLDHLGADDHPTATQVRNCLSLLAAEIEGSGPQPVFAAAGAKETKAEAKARKATAAAEAAGTAEECPLCEADINKMHRPELDALAAENNIDLQGMNVEDSKAYLISELCCKE